MAKKKTKWSKGEHVIVDDKEQGIITWIGRDYYHQIILTVTLPDGIKWMNIRAGRVRGVH